MIKNLDPRLLRHRCFLFPVAANLKYPAIAKEKGGNGYLDASNDPAQIRAWSVDYPDCNWGFAAQAIQ